MPRPRTAFDDKRARIAALGALPPAQAAPELRKLIGDKNPYLAGEAAEVAGKLELRELGPDLAAAFKRLLGEGAADKGCLAKRRILEAMLALEADERDAYLAGLHYEQMEPAYPKAADTAGPVRGLCAHALVQFDHPAALAEVTPLLMDPEAIVRAEAAHAIGRSGLDAAGPILHLKVLAGDAETDVIQSAFTGLLRVDARRYLPVVAAALRGDEEDRAEAAALALGESRLADALPFLKDAATEGGSRERRSVLMAIALHRSDAGNDFLLAQVEKAPEPQAAAALEALALHRHDPRMVERARQAVDARASRRMAQAFREHFGPKE
jgi:HEAT repeat protein